MKRPTVRLNLVALAVRPVARPAVREDRPMPRAKRPTPQPAGTPRTSVKPGCTKLTLVVPLDFAQRFRAFAGLTGQDLSAVVIEQVTAHLDRRRFTASIGANGPQRAADPGDGQADDEGAVHQLRAV